MEQRDYRASSTRAMDRQLRKEQERFFSLTASRFRQFVIWADDSDAPIPYVLNCMCTGHNMWGESGHMRYCPLGDDREPNV